MQYDHKILEGLRDIQAKSAERLKSCDSYDASYLTNPNLREQQRVQGEIIQLLKDTSRMIGMITTMDRAECSGKIARLDSCEIATSGAAVGGCEVGYGVTDSYIPYEMRKYKATFKVPRDFMDCNELGEPEQVKQIFQAMMLTSIRNDMERALIYGNEEIAVGEGKAAIDNLLGVNDGILKLATEATPTAQVIDAAGKGLSPQLFMAARQSLPPRYRPDRSQYRFFGGPGMVDWYATYLGGARSTEASEAALRNGSAAPIWGNQMEEIPLWREDFDYSGTETTHLLFMKPSNPLLLTRRKFDLRTREDILCDDFLSVAYWDQDVILQRPEEVVLITNVAVCSNDPWTNCITAGQDCDITVTNPVTTTTTAAATTTT